MCDAFPPEAYDITSKGHTVVRIMPHVFVYLTALGCRDGKAVAEGRPSTRNPAFRVSSARRAREKIVRVCNMRRDDTPS